MGYGRKEFQIRTSEFSVNCLIRMRQNLSLQSTIREIGLNLPYDELVIINLQHYGWKDLDIEVKDRPVIPDCTIFRIIA